MELLELELLELELLGLELLELELLELELLELELGGLGGSYSTSSALNYSLCSAPGLLPDLSPWATP